MAVDQLKALRRQFRNGEITCEEELYEKVSEYFCVTKSERYGLAALLFAEQPSVVRLIQKDKFTHSANSLKKHFLSEEGLRTIDVREYFEVVKQGDHILKRARKVFGVHFEDFETECKKIMAKWVSERLLANRSVISMRSNYREYYKDSHYLSFFESIFAKELNKRPWGHMLNDME
ncbi:Alfa-L-rhamnosidase in L-rhamnose subsystem [Vibrio chagasii]|nr:Alfa-L-rhamnosidase in L-rhamnose subsystem [Vibrio chagasii]